jgi:hypothetical protein
MPTVPVQFSITERDGLGTEAANCFYGEADDGATAAQLAAQWASVAALQDAITDGQIIRGSVTLHQLPGAGLKAAPLPGSRVEQTAVFNLSATGTTRRNGFDIPTLSDAVILAGKVDLANALVTAFWNGLAATGGIVRFTNAYGQPLITLIDVLLSFRPKRKQLARSSFEVAL